MARVLGIHQITFKEGATEAKLERFFREEFAPAWADVSGLKLSLCRGDKGKRDGEYLALFEFDSVEARDRVFSLEGPSEVVKARQDVIDKLFSLISTDFTDYVELYTSV